MNTSDNIVPNRSNEYLALVADLKHSISSAVDIASKIYEQGKRDGLSNEIMREDIELALDGVIKERQLRNVLPLELKRSYSTTTSNDNSAMSAELDPDSNSDSIGHEELVEHVHSMHSKIVHTYVRKLCLVLRDDNPKKFLNKDIQDKILKDMPTGFYGKERTENQFQKEAMIELIGRCWPDWILQPHGRPGKEERIEVEQHLNLIRSTGVAT